MTENVTPSAFETLLAQCRSLKSDVLERVIRQGSEQPDWLRQADARASSLQSLLNIVRYAELSLYFIARHLSDSSWWTQFRGFQPTLRELEFEFTAFSQSAKFATFHLALSAAENSYRSFLRALDPAAANGARREFKSVYDCLLRTHLSMGDEDVGLVDLLRLVRNTVHNEGVHRPPSIKPEVILHRGVRYEFRDGGPLEFVTWQFVLDHLAELVELQDRIIRKAPLWQFSEHIQDVSALVLPPSAA